jgi:hypothetical protein
MADSANNVIPHFVSEDSGVESLITNEPGIPKKPLKETAEAYFGSYSVLLSMPDGNGQNTLDYWFKPVEGGGRNLLFFKLPTGETFDLDDGYEEPFWNDNSGEGSPDNFPFNDDVLSSDAVAHNERASSTGFNAVQGFNGVVRTVPIAVSEDNLPKPEKWNHIALEIGNDSIALFLNDQQQTIPRMSSGFGGDTKIIINPRRTPIVLDEVMMDWTASISFARYSEVSLARLPWASHEWKEGWLTICADDPDRFDSNLALFMFPVGSVITQTTTGGAYNPDQTPWARFHNFRKEQFAFQGEVAPTGGNGEKTRFWQRIS